MASGFTVLLLFNYFRSVPLSLLEAARLDSVSDFTIFARGVSACEQTGPCGRGPLPDRWSVESVWGAAALHYQQSENHHQIALREVSMLSDATSGTDVVLANTAWQQWSLVSVLIVVFPFIRHFVQGIVLGATEELVRRTCLEDFNRSQPSLDKVRLAFHVGIAATSAKITS